MIMPPARRYHVSPSEKSVPDAAFAEKTTLLLLTASACAASMDGTIPLGSIPSGNLPPRMSDVVCLCPTLALLSRAILTPPSVAHAHVGQVGPAHGSGVGVVRELVATCDAAGVADSLGEGAGVGGHGPVEHGVPDDRAGLLGPEHVNDHAVDERGVGGVEWHVVLLCGCRAGVAGSAVLPMPG